MCEKGNNFQKLIEEIERVIIFVRYLGFPSG